VHDNAACRGAPLQCVCGGGVPMQVEWLPFSRQEAQAIVQAEATGQPGLPSVPPRVREVRAFVQIVRAVGANMLLSSGWIFYGRPRASRSRCPCKPFYAPDQNGS
jgi:hypothetical protein